jgi:hydroxymethylpyrimidine pyrophosphatase-like HAD family hydrolase
MIIIISAIVLDLDGTLLNSKKEVSKNEILKQSSVVMKKGRELLSQLQGLHVQFVLFYRMNY